MPTADGWHLALHHWPHRGPRRHHPVLMVHGLGANRLNLDLDERYSVARAASRRGFDTYVLELRGAGLSRAPKGRDRVLFQWGFEEYHRQDLPAAVRFVLEHAGATALHGFGHSMGGMLMYAMGTDRAPELRSITAVGVPLVCELRLRWTERRLLDMASRLPADSIQGRVPLRRLMGAAGRFVPLSKRLVDGILLNAANTDADVLSRMAREAIADIPLKLVLELTHQMANGNNGGAHTGPYAYEADLDKIAVPVFAVGGAADHVARPAAVRAAVRRLRSPDVRYREMGVQHGDSFDYGHIDLLVGRRAPEEVFPLLLDFLEEVD